MVSIRYFCGVGEFTWLKSRPRGCFASNIEEVARLTGGTLTVTVMASSCAADSKQGDGNCQSRLHERFAEDACWKLEERKVDAGGRHPPSFHSRARTGTSVRTE